MEQQTCSKGNYRNNVFESLVRDIKDTLVGDDFDFDERKTTVKQQVPTKLFE